MADTLVVDDGIQTIENKKFSDEITVVEQSSVSQPSSGEGAFYSKTDGKPYYQDDSGTEYDLTGQELQNGFDNTTDSTISVVDGTRTFTIQPAVSSFSFNSGGSRYTKSGSENIVWTDTEGIHFIYYDETGTLQSTTTFVDAIITTYALIAILYWDATNNLSLSLGEERHGNQMSSATHLYNHNTIGTRYGTGLQVADVNADANGDLDTSAQCSFGSGTIWDEDLKITIAADAAPASAPIFYQLGSTGTWRKIAATNFICTTTGSGRGAYNEDTGGGTWQLTEVTNNDFFCMHLFAVNDVNDGYFWIVGQSEYSSAGNARAGAETELFNIETTGLPIVEYKSIATFIMQTSNGYSNTVQSRVRSTDSGDDFIDWRFISSGIAVNISTTQGPLEDATDVTITDYVAGDLVVWNGTNWVDLTAGTDGQYLAADSGQTEGIQWETLEISRDTSPQLGGDLDVNSNSIVAGSLELITFTETALAVNHVNIRNAVTSGPPIIESAGDDTNVGLLIQTKGYGDINIFGGDGGGSGTGRVYLKPGKLSDDTSSEVYINAADGTTTAPRLSFNEANTNGGNKIVLKAPDNLDSVDRTWTLPQDDPSVVDGYFLTTNSSGILSFSQVTTDLLNDTTPQLGGMLDVNGQAIGDGTHELIAFTETGGGAVNHVKIANAGSGNPPLITVDGDDTNISLSILSKGDEKIFMGAGSGGTAGTSDGRVFIRAGTYSDNTSSSIQLYNDSGATDAVEVRFTEAQVNGGLYIGLKAPDSLANNRTWTLPEDDPSTASGKYLKTDANGVLSFDTPAGGGGGDVFDDKSPQLGGDLDVLTQKITTSTTNGNVELDPNGTGIVLMGKAAAEDSTYVPLGCTRTGQTTDAVATAFVAKSEKTTNMADGFGTGIDFRIEDDTSGSTTIASLNAERYGADNSGKIVLAAQASGTSTELLTMTEADGVVIEPNDTNYPLAVYRQSSSSFASRSAFKIVHKTSGSLGAGTGVQMEFVGEDSGGTERGIARWDAKFDGSNSHGYLRLEVRSSAFYSQVFDIYRDTIDFGVPIKPKSYSVAGLPSGEEGQLVYCSNGDAGSKCLAVYDGSNWKVVALGATVSAT